MRCLLSLVLALVVAGKVTGQEGPRVLLTSPAHDARYIAPGAITLSAEVTGVEGSGGRVEFYSRQTTNRTLVGVVANPPYTLLITNVPAGSNTFSATYTNESGVLAQSSPRTTLVLDIRAGGPDTSFDARGTSDTVRVIVAGKDGSILVGGFFQRYWSSNIWGLVRVSLGGEAAPGFSPPRLNRVWDAKETRDGKVIVTGEFQGTVARLNRDGTRDTSFKPVVSGMTERVCLQDDGSILLAGNYPSKDANTYRPLMKIKADDSVDTNFCSGTFVDAGLGEAAVQQDGKIWIGGRFKTVNGQTMKFLARLLPDGSVDPAFKPLDIGPFGYVQALAVQSDGRLLVGGRFETVNGVARSGLFRLKTDGEVDEDFVPGAGVNGDVRCFALQSDGMIYIGGSFSSYDGAACAGYARIDQRGKRDETFILPPRQSGVLIDSMTLDEKRGRLYIGGLFRNIQTDFSLNIVCLRTKEGPPLFSIAPGPSTDGQFAIAINTFAEETFHLEAKPAGLPDGQWSTVSSWIGDGLRGRVVTDTNAPAAGRIYRLRMDRREQ